MKRWSLILVLIILTSFFFCQKQNSEKSSSFEEPQEKQESIVPVAKGIKGMFVSVLENIQNGNVSEGAVLLLDMILMVKPKEAWPSGFENTILAAKEQFQNGDLKGGIELVSEARLLIRPPEKELEEGAQEGRIKTKQPQTMDEPVPIAEIFKRRILSARKEFKKGNVDKAVILILESFPLLGPSKD